MLDQGGENQEHPLTEPCNKELFVVRKYCIDELAASECSVEQCLEMIPPKIKQTT